MEWPFGRPLRHGQKLPGQNGLRDASRATPRTRPCFPSMRDRMEKEAVFEEYLFLKIRSEPLTT
jgi:hypothetical protein